MRSVLLGFALTLAACAAASAAVTIDGVISPGEWDGYIAVDPDDNPSNMVEMTRWGMKVEGAYLYWFCEIGDGQNYTDFQGVAGTKDKKIFPGLWIDVDNDGGGQPGDTGTWLTSGGTMNCADDGKKEWATNHRGIDIDCELGLIGNWVNGSNIGSGEGPGGSMYNYWGDGDNVGADPITVVTNGNWWTTANVLEARVQVSELTTKVASLPDGVVAGDYMMIALAVQGTQRPGQPGGGTIDYGYDVGTPTAIAWAPATQALLPGDANFDDVVDSLDASIVGRNWLLESGATWAMGDFSRDGKVNDADAAILAANWTIPVEGAAPAVPEPCTLALLLVGAAVVLCRRRRR
jgi:hypothetical protein